MEARFQETGEQIQTLREEFQEFRQETLQRFERVDQRFEKVDQQFEKVDQRFEKVDQRFDRAEDDVHGVHIVLEDLQGTVRLVAEGVTSVREELGQKTEELSRKIDETASFNRAAYEALEIRVRTLETAAKKVRSAKGGPRRS